MNHEYRETNTHTHTPKHRGQHNSFAIVFEGRQKHQTMKEKSINLNFKFSLITKGGKNDCKETFCHIFLLSQAHTGATVPATIPTAVGQICYFHAAANQPCLVKNLKYLSQNTLLILSRFCRQSGISLTSRYVKNKCSQRQQLMLNS